MSQLTLQFPLLSSDLSIDGGKLTVDLGNGVTLRTSIPDWVKDIKAGELILIMEVEGSPPDAKSRETPIE